MSRAFIGRSASIDGGQPFQCFVHLLPAHLRRIDPFADKCRLAVNFLAFLSADRDLSLIYLSEPSLSY